MQIQKPTIGRVVIFTARPPDDQHPTAGIVTAVYDNGVIDLVTFGATSEHRPRHVPFSAESRPMTWRYPDFSAEKIDV